MPSLPLTPEAMRQGYAASLMVSPRYNWIYSDNSREQLIGRGRDAYTGDAPPEHVVVDLALHAKGDPSPRSAPRFSQRLRLRPIITVRRVQIGRLGVGHLPCLVRDDQQRLAFLELKIYDTQQAGRIWRFARIVCRNGYHVLPRHKWIGSFRYPFR